MKTRSMPSAFNSKLQKENFVALGAATALFLASIEYIIPKPLPFMRLGLANLPILIALKILPPQNVFLLILLKAAGQSLIQGTFFSIVFLFSLSGSLSSGLAMIAAKKLLGERISLIGVSIAGALASNLIQIVLARLLAFGEYAWMIAPPLLLTGLVSSAILGFLAQLYWEKSSWLKKLVEDRHKGAL